MLSMTGFGRASRRDRKLDLEVEARSVNHRFLSLKVSLPEALARFEPDVEQIVRGRLARGSVSLTATMKAGDEGAPPLPAPARVKQVYAQLQSIRKACGLKGDVPFESVMAVPGLFAAPNHARETAQKTWPALRKLVDEALDGLVAMRTREGETIKRDLLARLDAIEKSVKRIRERAPTVLAAYEKKLDDRISSLLALKGLEIAKADLVKEIAIHAERCDISEELQRLGAHVDSFRRIVKNGGQIGRRLDFLTQEILRETNTLASKGSDSDVSAYAVEIKAELEKIKEQAENVE